MAAANPETIFAWRYLPSRYGLIFRGINCCTVDASRKKKQENIDKADKRRVLSYFSFFFFFWAVRRPFPVHWTGRTMPARGRL